MYAVIYKFCLVVTIQLIPAFLTINMGVKEEAKVARLGPEEPAPDVFSFVSVCSLLLRAF